MDADRESQCDHEFVLMDTKKQKEYADYITHWIRVDRFYCRRCLREEMKRKSEYSRDMPDWY